MQKKLGRKTLQAPATKEVQINETALQEAVVARDAVAIAQEVFTPARAALHETMGVVKSMNAVSSMTNAISLQKLKTIKDHKVYRELNGQSGTTPDGQPIENLGTWEGFCRHLGMSVEKVDEDLRNLAVFGQEALDRMSALGAGYRDLRQYRQLPDDKRQALIEVAKSGNKHDFLDLAEELIARSAKREAELTQQIADGKKELAASEERLAIVRRQREESESKEADRMLMTEAEKKASLEADVTRAAQSVWLDLMRLGKCMELLVVADGTARPVMAGVLKKIKDDITTLELELGLPVVSDLPAGAVEFLEWNRKQNKGIPS